MKKGECENCGGQGEVMLCVDCPDCKGNEGVKIHNAGREMRLALRQALLLAQETDHPNSERLRALFMEVLVKAGDPALCALAQKGR